MVDMRSTFLQGMRPDLSEMCCVAITSLLLIENLS